MYLDGIPALVRFQLPDDFSTFRSLQTERFEVVRKLSTPQRCSNAHRQVRRLTRLTDSCRHGRCRGQGGDRTRRCASRADRRDHLRQRAPGWRRTQSCAPDFRPQRRSARGSRVHREQGLCLRHEIDRARVSVDSSRRLELHSCWRHRIHVAPSLLSRGARWGYRLGNQELVDGMYRDGFFCPLAKMVMGETAEVLAENTRSRVTSKMNSHRVANPRGARDRRGSLRSRNRSRDERG